MAKHPLIITMLLLTLTATGLPVTGYAKTPGKFLEADRAVEIARQSRDRVERSSLGVQNASKNLFQSFAERTVELQKLLDTRRELEAAGFLNKDDEDGRARRAHINGKILLQVGKLKQQCDDNLPGLLDSLESFDSAVASSLVDSQATRSINSNYELALDQYLKQERKHFQKASKDAKRHSKPISAKKILGRRSAHATVSAWPNSVCVRSQCVASCTKRG